MENAVKVSDTKKVTKAEHFHMLRAIVLEVHPENEAELITFIDHELEMLANRNTKKSGAMTASQKANEEVKATITAVLTENDKPMTVTDLLADARLSGFSNQKIAALVNRMSNVARTVEKKKAYFSIKKEA